MYLFTIFSIKTKVAIFFFFAENRLSAEMVKRPLSSLGDTCDVIIIYYNQLTMTNVILVLIM